MIKEADIRKDGVIYTGKRHWNIFQDYGSDGSLRDGEQGFITDTGEFVNREEAWNIAQECGQMTRQTGGWGTLYSEDLY